MKKKTSFVTRDDFFSSNRFPFKLFQCEEEIRCVQRELFFQIGKNLQKVSEEIDELVDLFRHSARDLSLVEEVSRSVEIFSSVHPISIDDY
jgi:hypothetical protein